MTQTCRTCFLERTSPGSRPRSGRSSRKHSAESEPRDDRLSHRQKGAQDFPPQPRASLKTLPRGRTPPSHCTKSPLCVTGHPSSPPPGSLSDRSLLIQTNQPDSDRPTRGKTSFRHCISCKTGFFLFVLLEKICRIEKTADGPVTALQKRDGRLRRPSKSREEEKRWTTHSRTGCSSST